MKRIASPYPIVIILFILTKLWLVSDQGLVAFAHAAHDDLLFVRLANYLIQLEWLGPYDNLTLIKGPFYPLWIATTFLIGIPLLLSQHLLYIAACLITERALQSLFIEKPWRIIIFIFLLFNPVTFTWEMTRVLRESLYPGLTLLIVASTILLFTHRHRPTSQSVGWALVCGLSIAAFWLTREEGIWILPFLLPIILWIIVTALFTKPRNWYTVLIVAIPVLIPLLAIQAVSMINLAYYGIFTTVELKTPELKAAYGALTRVRPVEHKSQVPVTKDTRLRIYQVSPAFSELRPYFEKEGFWTVETILKDNNPSYSKEIKGGWFIWALRDAVAEAGYFKSGAQAAQFFQRLADEVNAACQAQKLDCLAERASLMPPWQFEYLAPTIQSFISGLRMLITFSEIPVEPFISMGPNDNLLMFQDLTREHLSTWPMKVKGWAVDASGKKLTVTMVDPSYNATTSSAQLEASPDVYQHFLRENRDIPSANNARFEVSGYCLDTCLLRVFDGDKQLAEVPLKKGPTTWFADPLWIFIDKISSYPVLPWQVQLEKKKLSLRKKIATTYQLTIPIFALITIIIFSIWSFHSIKTRTLTAMGFIALSIAAAICTRLLILAIIESTSFTGITPRYLAPLYPMTLLCASLFIIDALHEIEILNLYRHLRSWLKIE
ncbi:MAG: hypothetical protein WAU60_10780 [Candidatus Competibacter denitrificans]|jgi:hypothetical protein